MVTEDERSGEHPAALPIVRSYLVLLSDEAILVQKVSSRCRGLIDLLCGLVHLSNFVLDFTRAALGNDGNHAPQVSLLYATDARIKSVYRGGAHNLLICPSLGLTL